MGEFVGVVGETVKGEEVFQVRNVGYESSGERHLDCYEPTEWRYRPALKDIED